MFAYETECLLDESTPIHALIFKSSPNGEQLPYTSGTEEESFIIYTAINQLAVGKEDSYEYLPFLWEQMQREHLQQITELVKSTHLFAYEGEIKMSVYDQETKKETTVFAKGVIFKKAMSQSQCRKAVAEENVVVLATEILNESTNKWEKVSPEFLVGTALDPTPDSTQNKFYMAKIAPNPETGDQELEELKELPLNYTVEDYIYAMPGQGVLDGFAAIYNDGSTIIIYGLLPSDDSSVITARTSSGYDLTATKVVTEIDGYLGIMLKYDGENVPQGFYDKDNGGTPYTTITVTNGTSTLVFDFGPEPGTT